MGCLARPSALPCGLRRGCPLPIPLARRPAGQMPAIYKALEVPREGAAPLVLEVLLHLGDDWVRTVAMSTTDGLRRGMAARDTGAPIRVPVGPETLGRLFNVTGEVIDRLG